jgi:uncharacterized protein YbjT (DUF2867 family)
MTILVTGSTGTIGSQVVQQLANEGAQVRALALDTSKLKAPAGVESVKGDMTDVVSMRRRWRASTRCSCSMPLFPAR